MLPPLAVDKDTTANSKTRRGLNTVECTNSKSRKSIHQEGKQRESGSQPSSGLWYLPNCLTALQETQILNTIQETPYESLSIRRRLQFHGEVYYHTTHDVSTLQPNAPAINPLEKVQWLIDHVLSTTRHLYDPEISPTQLLVNEYIGSTGLSCHLEDPDAFGHYIYTISLVNPVWMDLKPILNNHEENATDLQTPMRILLEPRSVLILSGDSRYKWMHGITKTKSVQLPESTEKPILRDANYRRISLTLRYLKDGRKRVVSNTTEWVT
ncbi:hypothetical protein BDR26DRAFT_330964 [Obelidium mucronatum]|nr:hypothetical protein BDR26DRAFT_330964 [Obelidium mucronatum]